jgi:hypothetical protein
MRAFVFVVSWIGFAVAVFAAGGDTCGTATVIGALPYLDNGNTCGMTHSYDEHCSTHSASADAVYAYTPVGNRCVDVSLCVGTFYNSKLYVYASNAGGCPAVGSDNTGLQVACNDDGCPSPSDFASRINGLQLTGGVTYWFVVDGSNGGCGGYQIEMLSSCNAICQTADNCNDGNDCTVDSCIGGACQRTLSAPGTPCGDQLNTQCTDPDTCDGIGVCLANHAPDGTLCDDGLSCTIGDDCVGGVCRQGTPRNCKDGVACTVDSCDAATGACTHVPNNGACPQDGAFCNGQEYCNPAAGCASSGNPCQANQFCNESSDSCESLIRVRVQPVVLRNPNGLGVSTGNPPASAATVVRGSPFVVEMWAQQVQGTTGLSCVFADLAFDAGALTCVGTSPSSTYSVFATGTCNNGVGLVDELGGCAFSPSQGVAPQWVWVAEASFTAGVPRSGNLVQSGPASASVSLVAQGSVPVQRVQFASTPAFEIICGSDSDCGDGNVCTRDRCDSVVGCVYDGTGITVACNDRNVCTTNDVCYGDVPGTCAGTNVSVLCDDGLFCNGAETCDPVSGCRSGTPCPAPFCDEATRICLVGVPAVSHWGLASLTLLLLAAGTGLSRRRQVGDAEPTRPN